MISHITPKTQCHRSNVEKCKIGLPWFLSLKILSVIETSRGASFSDCNVGLLVGEYFWVYDGLQI